MYKFILSSVPGKGVNNSEIQQILIKTDANDMPPCLRKLYREHHECDIAPDIDVYINELEITPDYIYPIAKLLRLYEHYCEMAQEDEEFAYLRDMIPFMHAQGEEDICWHCITQKVYMITPDMYEQIELCQDVEAFFEAYEKALTPETTEPIKKKKFFGWF